MVKQDWWIDMSGFLVVGVADAAARPWTLPVTDKFWVAYYYGSDVPTNAPFVAVAGNGDWVMDPTHPMKKNWKVVKKIRRTHYPQWQKISGTDNNFHYAGYFLRFSLSRRAIEFNSNANGSAPSRPQGPFLCGLSSISPLAPFPCAQDRQIGVHTRTYFIDP